jgi:hypothetical protein
MFPNNIYLIRPAQAPVECRTKISHYLSTVTEHGTCATTSMGAVSLVLADRDSNLYEKLYEVPRGETTWSFLFCVKGRCFFYADQAMSRLINVNLPYDYNPQRHNRLVLFEN